MCLLEVFYTSYVLLDIERFHSRGQHICKMYWNKRKPLHKKRIQLPQDCLGTPTWLPFQFIVLEHQYGCRDVMWKHSIRLRSFAVNVYLIKNFLFMSPQLPDSFFCLFVCFSFFSKEGLVLFYINKKKANGKERRTNKRKERKCLWTT